MNGPLFGWLVEIVWLARGLMIEWAELSITCRWSEVPVFGGWLILLLGWFSSANNVSGWWSERLKLPPVLEAWNPPNSCAFLFRLPWRTPRSKTHHSEIRQRCSTWVLSPVEPRTIDGMRTFLYWPIHSLFNYLVGWQFIGLREAWRSNIIWGLPHRAVRPRRLPAGALGTHIQFSHLMTLQCSLEAHNDTIGSVDSL